VLLHAETPPRSYPIGIARPRRRDRRQSQLE
jgi:hypothetical protein